MLLDQRVRRGGSHHQKLVVVAATAGPDDDVAFVGGIDLCHGRRDDRGPPRRSAARRARRRALRRRGPPWHDIQLEVRGPGGRTTSRSPFAERWNDPTPARHPQPVARLVLHRCVGAPERSRARSPPIAADADGAGTHAVQVLRTYPARRPRVSVRARRRAQHRARVPEGVRARPAPHLPRGPVPVVVRTTRARSPRRCAASPSCCIVVVVIPRYPDPDGSIAGRREPLRPRARARPARRGRRRPGRGLRPRERRAARRSTSTRRCASSTTSGWRSAPTTSTAARGRTTPSCRARSSTPSATSASPTIPAGRGDGARRLARDTRLRAAARAPRSCARATPTISSTRMRGSTRCGQPRPTSTHGTTAAAPGHDRRATSARTRASTSPGSRGPSWTGCTRTCSTPTVAPDPCAAAASSERAPPVTRHPSPVTRHPSPVTRHPSM